MPGATGRSASLKWQLAIILPEEDRLIGNCGLRLDAPEVRSGHIGYELAPSYWGRDYVSERVLEKLGMQRERRQREHDWFKGRWWDRLLYGVLEHEWRGQATV